MYIYLLYLLTYAVLIVVLVSGSSDVIFCFSKQNDELEPVHGGSDVG